MKGKGGRKRGGNDDIQKERKKVKVSVRGVWGMTGGKVQ